MAGGKFMAETVSCVRNSVQPLYLCLGLHFIFQKEDSDILEMDSARLRKLSETLWMFWAFALVVSICVVSILVTGR